MAEAATEGSDVGVLAMLRFWGEVVVAVEYGQFWKPLERHFAALGRRSRFYHEHYSHDGCEPLATASSQTHSGKLGVCLRDMLITPSAMTTVANIGSRVVESRLRFYDQFARG